jgi:aspartate-semialdehyde dehydrogenase
VDDISNNVYPMPLTVTNQDDVEIGRIRESLIYSPFGIDLFISGDQLLRGAALNAVLIALKIIELQGLNHNNRKRRLVGL